MSSKTNIWCFGPWLIVGYFVIFAIDYYFFNSPHFFRQEILPDVLVWKIFTYLPSKSHLPTCNVSKTFRSCWLDMNHGMAPSSSRAAFRTNPLQIGQLYDTVWNQSSLSQPKLRKSLLDYYVASGWKRNNKGECDGLILVMFEAASRGDILGMSYIVENVSWPDNDCNDQGKGARDICTMAGAAGQLQALRWLREEKKYPWNPAEVFREASENSHMDVMAYVETCAEKCLFGVSPYGEGMPW